MRRTHWILLLTVVALVGSVLLYRQFGTATLSITSTPDGGVVRINGQFQGKTPVERVNVGPGRQLLRVEHSHYAVFEQQLDLDRGTHLQQHVVLEAGEGTLAFFSNPKGAWIAVNGERLEDRTPTTITLASGEHRVTMGLEERRTTEQVVLLKDGEDKEVRLDLNIDPHGSVVMSTKPAGAKVTLPEVEVAYSNGVRIPIGEHVFTVSKPGYQPATVREVVRYGDNHFHVTLKRAYGNLEVTASPSNAEIRVTSIDVDTGRRTQSRYQPGMRLPAGTVEVQVRALGFRSGYRRIDLGEQTRTLRFDLEPMRVEAGSEIRDKLRSGGESPAMIVIPAGSFLMGDAQGGRSEQPVHKVTLTQPFALSKFEVTTADYLKFVSATGASIHERVDQTLTDHPIAYVTHDQARAYADWLSAQTGERYRLPSEAEWEYAARAGANTRFSFGDDVAEICSHGNISDRAAWKVYRDWRVVQCDDGQVRPGQVGQYTANAFGLHDMYGNVAEWVLDCGTEPYTGAEGDGSPRGSACDTHGFRGGSWDSGPGELYTAYRNATGRASDDRGIRLLREL